MLTRTQSEQLLKKVLKLSSFPECQVSVSDSEQAFIRFANNGVTTSGLTVERTVTIQATRDNKTGVSQTTDLSDAALEAAVKRAQELAAIAPPNPERVPPLGPQKYPEHENFDERTATARSPLMVPQVKAAIDAALARKLVSAGFFNRDTTVQAFANLRGNFGYQRSADSRMTMTVRQPDGSSSGWAGSPTTRISEIDGNEIASRAIDKCIRWKNPVKLEPGRYTVVLEPTAVADIVQILPFALSARAAEEGRSFLSRKGGGTLAGEKLFPDAITLRSDPFDPRLPTQNWTAGDLPNRRIPWIEKGVVKNISYDRYWALKAEKEPTPFPGSLILDGESSSLPELIKSTDRGLLITRLWYIRMVNPQTVQITGLTRDGLFLIEGGELTKAVVNFRFNDSPVRVLQSVRQLGQSVRARGAEGQGMIVPPIQSEMTFTSLSDAV